MKRFKEKEKEEKEAQKRIKEENLKQEALKRKMVCELIVYKILVYLPVDTKINVFSMCVFWTQALIFFSHGCLWYLPVVITGRYHPEYLCMTKWHQAKLVWCTYMHHTPHFPDLAMTVSIVYLYHQEYIITRVSNLRYPRRNTVYKVTWLPGYCTWEKCRKCIRTLLDLYVFRRGVVKRKRHQQQLRRWNGSRNHSWKTADMPYQI